MLGVTFFGIFLTPVFYYVIQRETRKRPSEVEGERIEGPPPGNAAESRSA